MTAQLALSTSSLGSILAVIFAAGALCRQEEAGETSWLMVKPISSMWLALSWFAAIFSTAGGMLLVLGSLHLVCHFYAYGDINAVHCTLLFHSLLQVAVLSALAVPIAARYPFSIMAPALFILFCTGHLNDTLRTVVHTSSPGLAFDFMMLWPALSRFNLDILLHHFVELPPSFYLTNLAYALLWVLIGVSLGGIVMRRTAWRTSR